MTNASATGQMHGEASFLDPHTVSFVATVRVDPAFGHVGNYLKSFPIVLKSASLNSRLSLEMVLQNGFSLLQSDNCEIILIVFYLKPVPLTLLDFPGSCRLLLRKAI